MNLPRRVHKSKLDLPEKTKSPIIGILQEMVNNTTLNYTIENNKTLQKKGLAPKITKGNLGISSAISRIAAHEGRRVQFTL